MTSSYIQDLNGSQIERPGVSSATKKGVQLVGEDGQSKGKSPKLSSLKTHLKNQKTLLLQKLIFNFCSNFCQRLMCYSELLQNNNHVHFNIKVGKKPLKNK